MDSLVEGFAARAARIPVHGIGLSVDVFSPDLLELHRTLEQAGIRPDYLEIFKAPVRDLARVRAALPGVPLAYHAEGLWLIDPAMRSATPWRQAVETIARHAEAIGAGWANHECAGKQFGGYSFGTYLPPLLTNAAATAVAANAMWAQEGLDEWFARKGRPDAAPLLLLELPPLTYFGFGNLPVSEFFARIAEGASLGLVLDIGHLWTHWRYRERRRFRSLEAFAAEFLATFPLDRVVQIHLAGLGLHEDGDPADPLPHWIDRHDAPVPAVLFDLLRQVLGHPALAALKGIALEVDTKAVPAIVEEFRRLLEEPACRKALLNAPERAGLPMTMVRERVAGSADRELAELYGAYARVASGRESLEQSAIAPLGGGLDPEGLHRYFTRYLPHELVCWGGDLAELFPAVWTSLEKRGITAADFLRFWFGRPRPVAAPYDFFYVKLDRWVEFIGEAAPDLMGQVQKEAEILRALHTELNDEPAVLGNRT
ncbi:MAG: DUF692 family protein [Nitrospirae bacterium]|nr:MAG: DUF692 family protein [Nitrospirota bacterium]